MEVNAGARFFYISDIYHSELNNCFKILSFDL